MKLLKKKIEEWCLNNPYFYDIDINADDIISIVGRSESVQEFKDTLSYLIYYDNDEIALIESENFKKCVQECDLEKHRNSEIWDLLLETFFESFNIHINFDSILDSNVNVNVIFNFYNDVNTDFTGNGWMRYLFKSQGYKLSEYPLIKHTGTYYSLYSNKKFESSEFEKINKCNSKFIKSIYNECYNMPNEYIRMLTACVKMSINDYLRIYSSLNSNDNFVLCIDKNAMLGLFNNWSGSGSMLDIELERQLNINNKNINMIQLESRYGSKLENNRSYGYTVNEVYGMGDGAWNTIARLK